MTLEEALKRGSRLEHFTDREYIVGTPEHCHLTRTPHKGEQILASRAFAATDYANNQQGTWRLWK